MGIREEIKSYIVRSGMTMTEVVDRLFDDYDWSRSVPNLSGKLRRGTIRYKEAVELADVLDYDIVWGRVTGTEHKPLHRGSFRRFLACRRCLASARLPPPHQKSLGNFSL